MKVDEFFKNSKGVFHFPLLFIKNPSDALAVFLTTAPAGGLPVVIDYSGHATKVYDIAPNALVLKRLINIFEVHIFSSPEKSMRPVTLFDIIEAGVLEMDSLCKEE